MNPWVTVTTAEEVMMLKSSIVCVRELPLVLKFESPPKVAVTEWEPEVSDVVVHAATPVVELTGTADVQPARDLLPSMKVTEPESSTPGQRMAIPSRSR